MRKEFITPQAKELARQLYNLTEERMSQLDPVADDRFIEDMVYDLECGEMMELEKLTDERSTTPALEAILGLLMAFAPHITDEEAALEQESEREDLKQKCRDYTLALWQQKNIEIDIEMSKIMAEDEGRCRLVAGHTFLNNLPYKNIYDRDKFNAIKTKLDKISVQLKALSSRLEAIRFWDIGSHYADALLYIKLTGLMCQLEYIFVPFEKYYPEYMSMYDEIVEFIKCCEQLLDRYIA